MNECDGSDWSIFFFFLQLFHFCWSPLWWLLGGVGIRVSCGSIEVNLNFKQSNRETYKKTFSLFSTRGWSRIKFDWEILRFVWKLKSRFLFQCTFKTWKNNKKKNLKNINWKTRIIRSNDDGQIQISNHKKRNTRESWDLEIYFTRSQIAENRREQRLWFTA